MSYISDDVEKENKAYDYAMFLLNIRLRTEGELRGKMREKGYEGEVVDEVMARLKDAHYVNDRRFAEVYLENLT
jgi:regulatory protein